MLMLLLNPASCRLHSVRDIVDVVVDVAVDPRACRLHSVRVVADVDVAVDPRPL